jgi:two-component system chemotaxis response regulator CheB
MIKILVADDSPTARALLVGIFRSDPTRLAVIGEATDGREAVEMTRQLRPDVVTMDIRMPTLDGYEATRRIMSEVPTPIVVVSSREVLEVESSLEALTAGALAVMEKPAGPAAADFDERSKQILAMVRAMAGVKLVKRHRESVPTTVAAPPPSLDGRRNHVRAICMAASTGGPAAVQSIVSGLPRGFPIPILIVQHIAKGFVSGLATLLDRASRLRVKLAEPEEMLVGGTVYLAPDERHLGVDGVGRIVISAARPIEGFRPSATFLFQSAAETLGNAALGVILTGMGSDGIAGLRHLKARGGRIIAQDEASSVVFGMPGAAIEAGLADEVVRLADLPVRLLKACGERTTR